MGRSPSLDGSGLKKGPWTSEEDQKLVKHIQKHGHGSWQALPKVAGLNRCGKSCRLRWTNYLRPDIKRGKFSQEEEQTILHLHSILGNKWSAIATHLEGRTDNEIKNFWNTHLKKKLIQMGFDPMTHRPRTDMIFSTLPHLIALANLKDLLLMENHSWEDDQQAAAMRVVLQTHHEANSQMAKLDQYLHYLLQPPASINSSSTGSTLTDMDAYSYNNILLNSLSSMKDNPILSLSSLGTTINSSFDQSIHNETPLHFSHHLPDLEAPCSFQTPMAMNKDIVLLPSWLPPPSCSSDQSPPQASLRHVNTDNSNNNNSGDGCSSSSYGGPPPSFWQDVLLEDHSLFLEIA